MAERKGIMLAKPADIEKIKRWHTIIIQPKIEGIRGRVIIKDGQVTILSSQENRIYSVPHIENQFHLAIKLNCIPPNIEFDGEFYLHGMPFPSISSIVKRTRVVHPEHTIMEYHIFDVINEFKQYDRIHQLSDLGGDLELVGSDLSSIKVVDYHVVPLEGISLIFEDYVNQGYEGIILRQGNAYYERKRVDSLMKLKPRRKDEYQIIDTTEQVSIYGEPKDTLGAFICLKDGQTFGVGTGSLLTKEMRQKFWNGREMFKTGRFWAVIKYQSLTPPPREVPFFPAIIELKYKEE